MNRKYLPEWLRNTPPSNFILLVILPLIFILFTSQPDFKRAFIFILGIDDSALPIFIAFLYIFFAAIIGIVIGAQYLRGKLSGPRTITLAIIGLVVHAVLLYIVAFQYDASSFINSVISSTIDRKTDAQNNPEELRLLADRYTLSDYGQSVFQGYFKQAGRIYLFAILPILTAIVLFVRRLNGVTKTATWIFIALSGLVAFYLLFLADLRFASGLLVTLRASLWAYFFAGILGLIWAGLLELKRGDRTLLYYLVATVALAALSGFFFTRPQVDYKLIGNLDGRVAFVEGIPKRIADTIRSGSYDSENEKRINARAYSTVEDALADLETNASVSAAFVPAELAPADANILWESTFLETKSRSPALIAATFAALLFLLTLASWQSGLHPLASFAQLFIDVVRGVPMLVIILFVGFPLSSALKDASGGVFDMPKMIRGISAIALGYSAYMAEIFRAGIEAIPKGQFEASRSLGLSGWQTARFVILPQALKIVIPPLGNDFIAMFKDTALLSVLSIRDLTQRMREFQANTFILFPPYYTAAIIYIYLTLGASSFLKWIERKTDTNER